MAYCVLLLFVCARARDVLCVGLVFVVFGCCALAWLDSQLGFAFRCFLCGVFVSGVIAGFKAVFSLYLRVGVLWFGVPLVDSFLFVFSVSFF